MRQETDYSKAAQFVIDALALDIDAYSKTCLEYARQSLALMPMKDVLDKVYGDTTIDKYERVGVSRSTWYDWYTGKMRPRKKQAMRLQKLTDIPWQKFAGRR